MNIPLTLQLWETVSALRLHLFNIQANLTSLAPILTAIFETDMALKEARETLKY